MSRILIDIHENATQDPEEILVALKIDGVLTNRTVRHAGLKAELIATPREIGVPGTDELQPNPAREVVEDAVIAEMDAVEGREANARATAIAASAAENEQAAAVARTEGEAAKLVIIAANAKKKKDRKRKLGSASS